MATGRTALAAIGLLALALGISGFLVFRWVSATGAGQASETSLNLGVTYLPVTPSLSSYYGLGVYTGDLVTAVSPNSLADRAGIKAGDVLLKFNGVALSEDTPLLAVVRTCVAGHKITLEVWRQKSTTTLELIHTEK